MARFWRFSDGTNHYDMPKRETFIALEDLVAQLYETDEELAAKIENALREAQLSQQEVATLNETIALLEDVIGASYSNVYTEDGYLILINNRGEETDRIGPFAGGGGGGGGTGSVNGAVFTMQLLMGWNTKKIAYGRPCKVIFDWSSIEDGLPTGVGEATVTVNGGAAKTYTVAQGEQTIDIGPLLELGSNTVKLRVSDTYGNGRTTSLSVTTLELSISSSFDATVPLTGETVFSFTPIGSITKTVHFKIDGEEVDSMEVVTSGRQCNWRIPELSHGSHTLSVYFDAEIDGELVDSNILWYDLTCLAAGQTSPVITSDYNEESVTQYDTALIPYKVYHPSMLSTPITITDNGETLFNITVDRTVQTLSYRAEVPGSHIIGITCEDVTKTIILYVDEIEINVEAETNDLDLMLSSRGRSNGESNPGRWTYKGIESVMTGFNYKSNGWMTKDGIPILKVNNGANVTIPLNIYEDDFRTKGKTIEVEFSVEDVRDYDSVVISCLSGGRGFKFSALEAYMASERVSLKMDYKDNERIRLTAVYEKQSENRLISIFIDGVWSACVQYPADDDFSQANPVGISIGSNGATVNIYNMRVYSNNLSNEQILNNFIADAFSGDEMTERYVRNDIYDDYGKIIKNKLPKTLPYCILHGAELPQFKGNKKVVDVEYVNPMHPEYSFYALGVQIDVQGTSSQGYYVKNYKIKCSKGFTIDGQQYSKYAINENAIPVSTFCFKADVASCESTNNLQLVRFYEMINPFKTPAQIADPRVRQGIDGHGMIVFWDDGYDTTFLGKVLAQVKLSLIYGENSAEGNALEG